MASEQLLTLGFWAVLALAVAGGALLVLRLRARRRRLRLAIWEDLCLRLELVPTPGMARRASGDLQGVPFSLHDTGADWLLEYPLARPLLPDGVILLPKSARRLRPPFSLRRLRLRPAPPRSRRPAWFLARSQPPSRALVTETFLAEAERADSLHAPLRVEPRALVHALSPRPSVSGVRESVRALDATAHRWLRAVDIHGLPQIEVLPPVPSALSLLRGVLARPPIRNPLLSLNAGIPPTLGALLLGWDWSFAGLVLIGLFLARRLWKNQGFKGLGLGALILASTYVAPWFWAQSMNRGTSPSTLSVREAPQLQHREADFFRFRDAVLRTDLRSPRARGLVPVVPEDWRPGEAVAVFAVRPPADPLHAGSLGAIVARPPYGTGHYRQVALTLSQELKFPVHPHALFLDFSTHPDAEISRMRRLAVLCWFLPQTPWLGWALVAWLRAFRASRRVLD